MTDAIRPAHYVYSDEMKARYKLEPTATPEAFTKRSLAFDLLQTIICGKIRKTERQDWPRSGKIATPARFDTKNAVFTRSLYGD